MANINDLEQAYLGGGNINDAAAAVYAAGRVAIASVTLTSAQVLAISTTPVTVVAAPGAGRVLVPILYAANYTFVTTAYNSTAGTLLLGWSNAGTVLTSGVGITATGFWDQTHSTYAQSNGVARSAANVATQVANLPLVVREDTANPTLGDGTVTVTVAYIIVPVS